MPFALAGILTLINHSYMSPLYTTTTGHVLIVIALLMMFAGYAVLRRIVKPRSDRVGGPCRCSSCRNRSGRRCGVLRCSAHLTVGRLQVESTLGRIPGYGYARPRSAPTATAPGCAQSGGSPPAATVRGAEGCA